MRFIHAERANYPVRVMCRVLRVSTSGYYAQMKRAPSKRQCEDGKLKLRIQAIHAHSRGTYGRERVRRQLDGENVEVGKQRVARLMREMGLQGLPSKRSRRTTDSKHDRPIAPNVLGRNFEAERPNQFWVTDITYIRTSSPRYAPSPQTSRATPASHRTLPPNHPPLLGLPATARDSRGL